jgi:hypothetical protein
VLSPTDPTLALSGDQADRAFLWHIGTGEKRFELVGTLEKHTENTISFVLYFLVHMTAECALYLIVLCVVYGF